MEIIEFKGDMYPKFQTNGNAARFCRPFALEVCKGTGFDIGYCKDEWKFPGAIGIEPSIEPEFHAMNLPNVQVDYIHSSHMLEHYVGNWSEVLKYWHSRLRSGGVLFLYLPDFSQKYWRLWSNVKHCHTFSPQIMKAYFEDNGEMWSVSFVSGVDAYNAFIVIAEKA